MNRVELLAPAKDLHKAYTALRYGADAVYVGGKSFSLRSRASNFEVEDIASLVTFAHSMARKVYVTVNIVFHDDDFKGLIDYLKTLQLIKVDGIIVESMAVMVLCKKYAPNLECHISTQASATTSMSINALKSFKADRVVVAREVSMKEIEIIAKRVDVPLEVFIHGGMCSNYSGRCTLSNRMTNRDANRGGCAQSCRWKYHIYESDKKVSNDDCLLSMSSKDLRASAYIERMIKAGIASLKIEGRMKSDYYIAQVVKTYRNMIDEVLTFGHLEEERIIYYDKELSKAENRPSDDGFLSGVCDHTKHLYGVNGAGVTHDFVAYVLDFDLSCGRALIEVRNRFSKGDSLEAFGPDLANTEFRVGRLLDEEGNEVEVANRPMQKLWIEVPFLLKTHYMIRKVKHDY